MDRWDGQKVEDWKPLTGKRCIVIEDRPLGNGVEVIVREVSPSSRYVKLSFPSGNEDWKDSKKWLLIECLEANDG